MNLFLSIEFLTATNGAVVGRPDQLQSPAGAGVDGEMVRVGERGGEGEVGEDVTVGVAYVP